MSARGSMAFASAMRFCPGCDRVYAKAGFVTHCRSTKHKIALYEYDQRQIKVIRDVLLALGGGVVRERTNEHDPLGPFGDTIAHDEVEVAIETVHGKLTVTPVRGGTVFCRFEEARRAAAGLNAGVVFGLVNPFSGKYNFHYDGIALEDQHVEHFFRELWRILPDDSPDWMQVWDLLREARKANRPVLRSRRAS